MGSSQTRARTCVPCIGRWILNHCATREALSGLLYTIFCPCFFDPRHGDFCCSLHLAYTSAKCTVSFIIEPARILTETVVGTRRSLRKQTLQIVYWYRILHTFKIYMDNLLAWRYPELVIHDIVVIILHYKIIIFEHKYHKYFCADFLFLRNSQQSPFSSKHKS